MSFVRDYYIDARTLLELFLHRPKLLITDNHHIVAPSHGEICEALLLVIGYEDPDAFSSKPLSELLTPVINQRHRTDDESFFDDWRIFIDWMLFQKRPKQRNGL